MLPWTVSAPQPPQPNGPKPNGNSHCAFARPPAASRTARVKTAVHSRRRVIVMPFGDHCDPLAAPDPLPGSLAVGGRRKIWWNPVFAADRFLPRFPNQTASGYPSAESSTSCDGSSRWSGTAGREDRIGLDSGPGRAKRLGERSGMPLRAAGLQARTGTPNLARASGRRAQANMLDAERRRWEMAASPLLG